MAHRTTPTTLLALLVVACGSGDTHQIVARTEPRDDPPAITPPLMAPRPKAIELPTPTPDLEVLPTPEPTPGEPPPVDFPDKEAGQGGQHDAFFARSGVESLAAVALREDHPKPACRSPLGFLRTLRSDLQGLDREIGACVVTLASPDVDAGASLQFRCPVRHTGRLCTEYYQGFVWLTLESEASLRPYSATYTLEGISRGYVHCRRSPEQPNTSAEESTRKLPEVDSEAMPLDGALFTRRAEDCAPGG